MLAKAAQRAQIDYLFDITDVGLTCAWRSAVRTTALGRHAVSRGQREYNGVTSIVQPAYRYAEVPS